MLKQDDPKKCSAAKLVKFGLAKNVKKTSAKTLILDPFAKKSIMPSDKKLSNSITAIDCLISESTRKPGQIYEVVFIDGMYYNVRYSGPDVLLEKYTILPVDSDAFFPDSVWNVEVIKEEQSSRLYYKVTYVVTG